MSSEKAMTYLLDQMVALIAQYAALEARLRALERWAASVGYVLPATAPPPARPVKVKP